MLEEVTVRQRSRCDVLPQQQELLDISCYPQRPLYHIWTHKLHFNEKLKVILAHFGLSATPRATAGHDVTRLPSCPEVSAQASIPRGSVGLKGFLASGHLYLHCSLKHDASGPADNVYTHSLRL